MDTYQKMVVIFVDLLGTKNNKKFEDKFSIHRLFHGEVKINEKRNLERVIYDRKIYSFSDCAYFFYYYKDGIDDKRKDDMKLLQIAISNTSYSLLRILHAGYLVRGGIAFGDAYFDELGFFGPAVEEVYELECNYADIPIIALNSVLGRQFYTWEESQTNMEIVNLLMSSRPMLVERENDKYFLNMFYQLETFSPSLNLETEIVDINRIKQSLFKVIARDKAIYKEQRLKNKNKSTIYEKLNWLESYLESKHNRLKPNMVEGAFSGIVCRD